MKYSNDVSITTQANSSTRMPILHILIDLVEKVSSTCHYLLSQNGVDHYPHSKSRPYVNLGFMDVALKACKGMLSLTLEHTIIKYQDQSDHWYLWWSVIL